MNFLCVITSHFVEKKLRTIFSCFYHKSLLNMMCWFFLWSEKKIIVKWKFSRIAKIDKRVSDAAKNTCKKHAKPCNDTLLENNRSKTRILTVKSLPIYQSANFKEKSRFLYCFWQKNRVTFQVFWHFQIAMFLASGLQKHWKCLKILNGNTLCRKISWIFFDKVN